MSQVILKKSSVAGKAPVAADLVYGEVALNYADGLLYFKTNTNSIGIIGGAGSITNTQIDNWTTAYNWGNHALAGYLTSISSAQVTSALGYTPYNATNPSGFTSNTGTVTSVLVTVPTGLTATNTAITTSGTIAIGLDVGYSIPTTVKQTNWDTAYTDRNKWDGGATGLVAATARTSLGLVIGTNVQAWDADLDAIAGLVATSGFLKKTALNAWTLDTNTYLTANQSITASGDVTGTGTTAIALTLAASGVTAGSYGSSTAIPVLTIDAKGRITAASTSTVTIGAGALTLGMGTAGATNTTVTVGTGTGFTANSSSTATYDIKVGPALTALATLMTTAGVGFIKRGATADTYTIDTSTYLTGNQTITLTGDTTGSGTTSISTTTNYIYGSDDRAKAPADDSAFRLRFGFTSWANNNTAPYADYIHLRSYADSSGGNDNLVTFRKDAIGMRIWQQAFGSATAYSSYVDVIHSGNYSSYALPLSGGVISGQGYFRRNQTNGDYTTAALWTESYGTTTTGIAFHISGTVGKYLEMRTDGKLYWNSSIILNDTNYNSYSPTLTGGGASGSSWAIGITGNAATATKTTANSGYVRVGYGMAPFYNWGGSNAGSGAPSDTTYTTGIDVGSHPSDQSYGFQIASNMWNIGLWTRTYNSGWSGWVRILDTNNYNSYSPTLTGGGASGTWSIAATAVALHASNEINLGGGYTGNSRLYINYNDGGSITEHAFYNGGTSLSGLVASYGTFSGAVVAYSSDERLKQNFIKISNPIEKLRKINGYEFDWDITKCASLDFTPTNVHEHGVKAQEIQKVIPDAVVPAPFDTDEFGNSISGENYLTVHYDRIVPLLIEAVKYQQDTIDSQNARIARLEALVEKLIEG